jgi:histone-lysine N-methyltransferase SETMAR
MAMLDNIVTMDETMVCHHTPATKKQSMQWVKKGQPGPIKAKVHASRTKQMLLAFFDSKGLIYSHIVPKGSTVNSNYIVKALGNFLKQLKKKRPQMVEQEWWFHWDNAPVHTAAVVQNWFAAHNIQRLDHPPYSPDLAPADFFLFRRVKEELAGQSLDEGTLKTTWERVVRSIGADEFATAFRRWYERCQKCIEIGGGYVEKT